MTTESEAARLLGRKGGLANSPEQQAQRAKPKPGAGQPKDYGTRGRILAMMRVRPDGVTCRDVADLIGHDRQSLYYLQAMRREGLVTMAGANRRYARWHASKIG